MFHIFTWFADIMTYDVLRLSAETQLAHAAHFFIEDVFKIIALLTALMTTVGFFRSWLEPKKLRAWVEGKPRILAYLAAVSLGAVTPFCSCSSISLFIAFLISGMPFGVVMAFLITSPMINEVAAILFGEAIGWTFTLAYIGTGMSVGILGGYLADKFGLSKWVEDFVDEQTKSCCSKKEKPTLLDRLKGSWKQAWDMVSSVWIYIVIGVGIGAGIHGYVPQEWFIEHASAGTWYAVPLAVIMAMPLYANVTGVVPVADVLINKGLPVGTTLAFIMSTVAISLPEMMILRRVLKPQMLVTFAAFLAVMFIFVGYGFNIIFS